MVLIDIAIESAEGNNQVVVEKMSFSPIMIVAICISIITIISLIIIFVLVMNKRIKNNPKLQIRISQGCFSFPTGQKSEPMLAIKILNRSNRPIAVDSFGFIYSDNSRSEVQKPFFLNMPCDIPSHGSISTYYPFSMLLNLEKFNSIRFIFFGNLGNDICKYNLSEDQLRRIKGTSLEGNTIFNCINTSGSFDITSRI